MDNLTSKFPWDFETQTNGVVLENVLQVRHADPVVEEYRAAMVENLRNKYRSMCIEREGVYPPVDCMSNWFLESKVVFNSGIDPLLPGESKMDGSSVICRDLVKQVLLKLERSKFKNPEHQILHYGKSALKMIEERNAITEIIQSVKWIIEDTNIWLKRNTTATDSEYLMRLTYLGKLCYPFLKEAVEHSVSDICKEMSELSVEYAKGVHELETNRHKEQGLEEDIELNLNPPRATLPKVDLSIEKTQTVLRYNGVDVRLNSLHLQKLKRLYEHSCQEDLEFQLFLPRVWCLLKRYQSYMGDVTCNEGQDCESSLPLPVFDRLKEHFGVSFECFASPLNCYFRQYCSLFPDTDGYFGSRGSVFEFEPTSGSFQANPPFCHEVINRMVTHFERLLSSSNEPLSFIVFMQDPTPRFLKRLEESKWNKRILKVLALEHEYRHGYQHVLLPNATPVLAAHGKCVVWLQNDQGHQMWTPTDQRVDALLKAFRPNRESEWQSFPLQTTRVTSTVSPPLFVSHVPPPPLYHIPPGFYFPPPPLLFFSAPPAFPPPLLPRIAWPFSVNKINPSAYVMLPRSLCINPALPSFCPKAYMDFYEHLYLNSYVLEE